MCRDMIHLFFFLHIIALFQTIKALQTLQRIETQWGILVDKIFNLEDVAKNQVSHDRRFKSSFPKHRSLPFRIIYNSIVGKLFLSYYFVLLFVLLHYDYLLHYRILFIQFTVFNL